MILSDRTIREALASGHIAIDPLDDTAIQPSSVDLRLGRYFRVFLNHTMPVIDVKKDLSELTREVEIEDGAAFILHPGEFVLGSTHERIQLPDDLVARIEGKSSLGRLGLLIHSSVPASEPLLVLGRNGLTLRTIGELVKEPEPCKIVAFDPETLAVGYHDVTGYYEGPTDRIFEVRLASGRAVRVTAGHNLFTLDENGELRKVRTAELRAGLMVAVPRHIPTPPSPSEQIHVVDLLTEAERDGLCLTGPRVVDAFTARWSEVSRLLAEYGYSPSHYRSQSRLPWKVAAQLSGFVEETGPDDRLVSRGGRHAVPAVIPVDREIAWMLGMYVAEGYRRSNEIVISNTDQARLDRLAAIFKCLGVPVYRTAGAITCCSSVMSSLFRGLGMGGKAPTKRSPPIVFGWSDAVLEAFLGGLVDGDGSTAGGRTSIWTTSTGLVSDVLLIFARLGRRAAACCTSRATSLPLWQVSAPRAGVDDGGLAWDRVVDVVDTGASETVYDLEVRPDGCRVENFLAGHGGVFVSNTAGFIDAGFDGHITLELSNVANLPITLYPGMRVGQVSFLQMTTPAERPYGRKDLGSKYQGQRGPTPSRYFENFEAGD